MSIFLNYWHYLAFFVFFLVWIGGMVASSKAEKPSLQLTIFILSTFSVILLSGASIVIIDKYTKFASLHKLTNKRLLSVEKIMYAGIVKNDGQHTIGEVTFEIKIVSQIHLTGNSKAKSMDKSGGFLDLIQGITISSKPQMITKEFIIAKNLKPGQSKAFRVYFAYPPYFQHASYFTRLYMH